MKILVVKVEVSCNVDTVKLVGCTVLGVDVGHNPHIAGHSFCVISATLPTQKLESIAEQNATLSAQTVELVLLRVVFDVLDVDKIKEGSSVVVDVITFVI